MKNIHSSAQNPAEFSNFEFSYRVGFGAKNNMWSLLLGTFQFLVIGWAALGFY